MGDETFHGISFDVQVAQALAYQADALEHLGDRKGALAACAELLTRFKSATSDEMKRLKEVALSIEVDYGVPPPDPTLSPDPTPSPPAGGPRNPGDTAR